MKDRSAFYYDVIDLILENIENDEEMSVDDKVELLCSISIDAEHKADYIKDIEASGRYSKYREDWQNLSYHICEDSELDLDETIEILEDIEKEARGAKEFYQETIKQRDKIDRMMKGE